MTLPEDFITKQDFDNTIALTSRIVSRLIRKTSLYNKARNSNFIPFFKEYIIDEKFKTQEKITHDELKYQIDTIFNNQTIDGCLDILNKWEKYYHFIHIIDKCTSREEAIEKLNNKKKLIRLITEK